MKKKDIVASYTVEAALIFPFIFFVIFALLFMCFYLKDRVLMKGVLNCYCERESRCVAIGVDLESNMIDYEKYFERGILYPLFSDFSEEEETLKQSIYTILNEKLKVCEIQKVQVQIDGFSVDIEVWYTLNIPLKPIRKYYNQKRKQLKLDAKDIVHHPAEFMRIYDATGDIISKQKENQGLKNRIYKIYNVISGE